MSLQIGQQFGSYEVTALLGKGGMGEVYRARDLKLKREVAIKILPEEFSRDTDRVRRFQREAEVLASLNHPNIAAIYGIEQSGGLNFLVMELVPGETLAQRVKRGAIPIPEALGIATQITQALEAAHEKSIVHRDLKPANVKVTPDGKVKVLDFGLAKALESEPANSSLSNSPTMSLASTQPGVILGTPAYMSPEQAKGQEVDRRTDIFAFGCVLYEMLAGRPAFAGEDVTDILSRVLQRDPDWTRLTAHVPSSIHRLVRLCLEKDVKRRRQSAGDVRIDIEQALVEPVVAAPARGAHPAWIVAAATAGVVAIALTIPAARYLTETSTPKALLQLSAELGADASLATGQSVALALSPDGTALAFVGSKDGTTQLYLRRLGQLQSTPLAGTGGASDPFFKPDGQWIGFFADRKLKKVSVAGGAAVEIADAPAARGGAWGTDDYIVFNSATNSSLMRVSSGSGAIELQTKLGEGEGSHRWPQVLPGAKGILYTTSPNNARWDDANIMLQPLPNGAPKVLQRGGYYARYLPSGHLVYVHNGKLFAAPFSLDQLAVTGPSVPAIDEDVANNVTTGRAQYAVSDSGVLAYVPGQRAGQGAPILWLGRDGKTTPLHSTPADWNNLHFSPDGRKLAMDIFDGKQIDVWVYEWARDKSTKFTFDAANEGKPVWTFDGQRIVFYSNSGGELSRVGAPNLYWQRADGTGVVQRLTESKMWEFPGSWQPNGKLLAFSENNPQTGWDLMILSMEGDEASGWKPGKPTVFLNTPFNEQEPMFSPDGRWLAYYSDGQGGRSEVFVRPFPGPGRGWQISTAGGTDPIWSLTRQELNYRTPDNHIMVASYTVEGDSFTALKPRLLSDRVVPGRPRQGSFDLHPGGERFAVSGALETPTDAPSDKTVFIFNFFDELRRIAPHAKR